MLVDSHCHLDFPDFSGREDEFLQSMAENDVGLALIAGWVGLFFHAWQEGRGDER